MPKSVNVILNSLNSVSGNMQQANYYFDWGAVLDHKKAYYMHFVYLGEANTINGSKLATIYATFNTENYTANTGMGAPSTQMLGFLMPTVLAGSTSTSFLQSLDNTNLPIYMKTPPNNNNFTISIYDNEQSPALFLDNATVPVVPGAYILILRFTEVNDSEI